MSNSFNITLSIKCSRLIVMKYNWKITIAHVWQQLMYPCCKIYIIQISYNDVTGYLPFRMSLGLVLIVTASCYVVISLSSAFKVIPSDLNFKMKCSKNRTLNLWTKRHVKFLILVQFLEGSRIVWSTFDTNKLFNVLSVMWLRTLMKYCDICVVTQPVLLSAWVFLHAEAPQHNQTCLCLVVA